MRLISLETSGSGSIHDFNQPLVIGRAAGVDIQIVDRFVSREHCVIEKRDSGLFVRDLDSRHGTWVNGEQIESASLHDGDVLVIGLSKFRASETETETDPDSECLQAVSPAGAGDDKDTLLER